MTKTHKGSAAGSYKSTELGRINRNIEKSVSGVFQGKRGAAGEALNLAKKREIYLYTKPSPKKIPA